MSCTFIRVPPNWYRVSVYYAGNCPGGRIGGGSSRNLASGRVPALLARPGFPGAFRFRNESTCAPLPRRSRYAERRMRYGSEVQTMGEPANRGRRILLRRHDDARSEPQAAVLREPRAGGSHPAAVVADGARAAHHAVVSRLGLARGRAGHGAVRLRRLAVSARRGGRGAQPQARHDDARGARHHHGLRLQHVRVRHGQRRARRRHAHGLLLGIGHAHRHHAAGPLDRDASRPWAQGTRSRRWPNCCRRRRT